MSADTAPLCNRCGLSCTLGTTADLGGIIRYTVTGGYESTPGNGSGALDDLDGYTFSLCEFCLDWLFQTFVIPVDVCDYSDGQRSNFRPAARRVEEDDWRRMKDAFKAEHERRARARDGKP